MLKSPPSTDSETSAVCVRVLDDVCDVRGMLQMLGSVAKICAHDGVDEEHIEGEIQRHSCEVKVKDDCDKDIKGEIERHSCEVKVKGDRDEEKHVGEYVEPWVCEILEIISSSTISKP